MSSRTISFVSAIAIAAGLAACTPKSEPSSEPLAPAPEAETAEASPYLSQPLVTEIYTADPSAHVWNDGKIYIYPSHDYEAGVPEDDLGSHFDMRDYQVLSMDEVGGPVTVHPVALDKDDVPWVGGKPCISKSRQ